MQKRDVLNSPRLSELKKRRRRIFLNKIIVFFLTLLALVGLLVYLSRMDKMNISSIEVEGNQIVDTEEIKAVVEKEIAGRYLWLFPKTNIFFYPKNVIRAVLQDNFKRLKDIELSVEDRRLLNVMVTERDPKYTWCGENLLESQAERQICYFMDETGYIFDEAPYFSGDVYFKFYGQADLLKTNFPKLLFFKETLLKMELEPSSAYLAGNGDVKVLLSPSSEASTVPEIIFKIESDFEKVAENLQAALSTEPLQTDFKKKYSSLEYIDLRYGNKVFYRFK